LAQLALRSGDPTTGRLYVATAAGVRVVDRRGHHLGTIRVPSLVRNLAFGGPSRRTPYLMAAESLFRMHMVSEGPLERAKQT